MRYIFCSFVFDDAEENIKRSKSPNSVSGHKVQINMLKGLKENGCDIECINIPRIRRYPDYKKIIIRKKDLYVSGSKEGVSVGFINLLGVNYLTQVRAVYKRIKKIVSNSSEMIVILIYNTYPAPTFAARKARKKFKNIILCDVIGDIYGQYGLESPKGLYGKAVELLHNKMDRMASECDTFALATENIADALGIKKKPHIIIEGMYEAEELIKSEENIDKEKIVFYAGALLVEYGIEHLLAAFSLISDPNYKLIIAGNGEASKLVEEAALKDNRIKYLGFITPSEVREQQNSATVLVNPRQSGREYIKYSFPSKNLECLASGVPYIAHNLPCNPSEYSNYIIYPEDESDEAFAKKIQEVCEMPPEERETLGRKAYCFIKSGKNPQTQMKKLDEMNIMIEGKEE